MKFFLLVFTLIGASLQCEDRGGVDFCMYVLRKKDNLCDNLSDPELSECLKTCKACPETPGSSSHGNRPPPWAMARPTPRQPLGPNRRNPERSDDEGPLELPLYAVIIIVIAVLVIFIGITVCVIKLKHKWKKRKINKNRRLLRNAPPPMNTMQPNYLWGTGSYNAEYHPEMEGWSRNMYLPGDAASYQAQMGALNNSFSPDVPGKKNINLLQNGTKEKRRAPNPPQESSESAYQNLHQVNNKKPEGHGKPKAPAPPPSQGNAHNVVQEISVPYSESAFSGATQQNKLQKSEAAENKFESWNAADPPALPPRAPAEDKDLAEKGNAKNPNVFEERSIDDAHDDDSDTVTLRTERSLSALTEDTVQTAPDLANVLNEWKEHLQEQKKELEDYYKNLHNYVRRLGLRPAGENESVPAHDRSAIDWKKSTNRDNGRRQRNKSEPPIYSDRQYASLHENHFELLKFPEPPESVRGDFTWEPNDEASQKQVIVELKKKLVRLQNLLESTQEVADSEKKSSTFYMPSQHSKAAKYQEKTPFFRDRVTIKALLQHLGERERLKVQMRIAQALDTSRRRGGMNIGPRDGPITCLSKQIHHVMNDILDPRTSTKIELGAHAACTLTNKLLSNIHTNLLPVLREDSPKQNVSRTSDRISMLTKQLLDMTKQLMARQTSFHSKDYSVFVNAFVDTTEKIMDATFHLVCVIVDLQRAERRGLMKNASLPAPARSFQRQSLPPQGNQEKEQLLSRLHSESNSTSLSVVDVRQLNEDLAKLRQLLNTETRAPTFSDVTAPRNPPFNARQEFPENVDSELDYEEEEKSDCETMSTFSCSTCMQEDPYYYSEDFPPPPIYADAMKLPVPPTNPKPKPVGKVQYTEVVFDQDTHRPSTRPRRTGGDSATLPSDALDRPKPLSAVSGQMSQVESAKESQRKVSTLEPSSFASFHTENEMRAGSQPRHQAMLARYFGGEALQPNTDPEKPKEYLKDNLPDQISPLLNAVAAMPLVGGEFDGSCPMVTMLPCGLVANDTPPIVNPPKEKRVKLPKIPEITVLRNGTEEELPETKSEKEPGEKIIQFDIDSDSKLAFNTRPSVEEPPLYATDTLPIESFERQSPTNRTTYDENQSNSNSLEKAPCDPLSSDHEEDGKNEPSALDEDEFTEGGQSDDDFPEDYAAGKGGEENAESDSENSVSSSKSSSANSDIIIKPFESEAKEFSDEDEVTEDKEGGSDVESDVNNDFFGSKSNSFAGSEDSMETARLASHSNMPDSFNDQNEEDLANEERSNCRDDYDDGLISEFEFPRFVSHVADEKEGSPLPTEDINPETVNPGSEVDNSEPSEQMPEATTDSEGNAHPHKRNDSRNDTEDIKSVETCYPPSEPEEVERDDADDEFVGEVKHDREQEGEKQSQQEVEDPHQNVENGDEDADGKVYEQPSPSDSNPQKSDSEKEHSDRTRTRKSKDSKFGFKVPKIFGKKH